MDVQFQQRLQDIFKSSTAKGTVELVEVSQLSSYQPSKPFLLFGHGSKPLSKYTRVHRLWDTRDEGLFWKFWITRTDLKRRKWSKRIAINRSSLSLEKPKCPQIHIHDKRILKIKIVLITVDRYRYWGSRKTQNRGVERRQFSVRGRTPPPGEKTKKTEGTATPWQRVGSSELFSSSGERCEPAKSAKPERPHPSHFAFLFLVPLASLLRRGSRLVFH